MIPVRRRVLLALLAAPALAAQAPGPVFPPGSVVGMVPPPEMKLANTFTGFESRYYSALVIVNELSPTAYAELVGLDDDALLKRFDFGVLRRSNLRVGGVPAVPVRGRTASSYINEPKWLLIAGAPSRTALVTVQLPGSAIKFYTDEIVEAALTSVVFRPPLSLEESLDALLFTIGDFAGYRATRFFGRLGVLLTEGPLDVDPDAVQPRIAVFWSYSGSVPPQPRDMVQPFDFGWRQASRIGSVREEKMLVYGEEWTLREYDVIERGTGLELVGFSAMLNLRAGWLQVEAGVRAESRDEMRPRFRDLALSVSLKSPL